MLLIVIIVVTILLYVAAHASSEHRLTAQQQSRLLAVIATTEAVIAVFLAWPFPSGGPTESVITFFLMGFITAIFATVKQFEHLSQPTPAVVHYRRNREERAASTE